MKVVRGPEDSPRPEESRQQETVLSLVSPPPPPDIRADGLSLRYRGGRQAFKDVSLHVRGGNILALVGPSGCGKTSFLTCINRLTDLVEGCEVQGCLCVGKTNVMDPKVDLLALRKCVGMICQKPNPFPLTIWKNLEFPLREHGIRDRAEVSSRIEQSLRDVGLWSEVKDRLQTPALALSGGQQQRLCIARALTLGPKVLLMDEPCSALDPISSGVVEDLVASLRSRYTIVIVTHNLAQARRISDETAFFWVQGGSGSLIESGPTRQIFESPSDPLTSAYISGARG